MAPNKKYPAKFDSPRKRVEYILGNTQLTTTNRLKLYREVYGTRTQHLQGFADDMERLLRMLHDSDIMTNGTTAIAEERAEQIHVHGNDLEHDKASNRKGQLLKAATCYLLNDDHSTVAPPPWPWSSVYWKPAKGKSSKARIKDLTKAGALIAAEIDRLIGLEEEIMPDPTEEGLYMIRTSTSENLSIRHIAVFYPPNSRSRVVSGWYYRTGNHETAVKEPVLQWKGPLTPPE